MPSRTTSVQEVLLEESQMTGVDRKVGFFLFFVLGFFVLVFFHAGDCSVATAGSTGF